RYSVLTVVVICRANGFSGFGVSGAHGAQLSPIDHPSIWLLIEVGLLSTRRDSLDIDRHVSYVSILGWVYLNIRIIP
ncbi:hypothetical protein A2U01_0052811, partial [Trifolium medium]|nr:hypothetical protein [Trifolium medium]